VFLWCSLCIMGTDPLIDARARRSCRVSRGQHEVFPSEISTSPGIILARFSFFFIRSQGYLFSLCLSITLPYSTITLPYSTITFPYSTILQEYFELLQEYFRILRKKKQEFAATLLPPIFPLNRSLNAIWWQGGSPVFYFFHCKIWRERKKRLTLQRKSPRNN
jgi:hypothetical protein